MSGYTLAQERALAIMPKVTSPISIASSLFIIHEVYCDFKTPRGTTAVQRALVGMSIIDVLASFGWFLSTWAVPEGSFAFAAGNISSCNFQGFLLQLAIGAPLYNSSLALFYVLMINLRWTDAQLARIERWVHGFIISFSIGTSILLLQLEQYNHIGAVCWVIGEPAGCGNSSYQGSDVPCDRGNHAWAWGVALFYGPLWVCVIGCVAAMAMLYLEVRKTHRRSMRHSTVIGMDHKLNKSGADSNRVATQAILYCLSFVITWMPSTLWSIGTWFNWSHYSLEIAAATAEPLQGFWNCLIYLKSKPKSVRKIRNALNRALPCIFSPPSDFDPSLSFATGMRQNRLSNSNMSGGFSSGHTVEPFHSQNQQKPVHRDTASTAALDESKSSPNDLDRDTSGYDREENVNRRNDAYQFMDEMGTVDVCVPQMTTCCDDDESTKEGQEAPLEPPTPSDRTVAATESAKVHEASMSSSSGIEMDDVVHDETCASKQHSSIADASNPETQEKTV